jgi:hypothetical protein
MNKDSGIPLTLLQVDGGMTMNNLLMQLQADILQINVGTYISQVARIKLASSFFLSIEIRDLSGQPTVWYSSSSSSFYPPKSQN